MILSSCSHLLSTLLYLFPLSPLHHSTSPLHHTPPSLHARPPHLHAHFLDVVGHHCNLPARLRMVNTRGGGNFRGRGFDVEASSSARPPHMEGEERQVGPPLFYIPDADHRIRDIYTEHPQDLGMTQSKRQA